MKVAEIRKFWWMIDINNQVKDESIKNKLEVVSIEDKSDKRLHQYTIERTVRKNRFFYGLQEL